MASSQSKPSDKAVPKLTGNDDPKRCRHCNASFPSRTKLMKHVFSDVCRQEKAELEALQKHYDTLLEEHRNLFKIIEDMRKWHDYIKTRFAKESSMAELRGTYMFWMDEMEQMIVAAENGWEPP